MATAKTEPHLFAWRRVLLSEKGPPATMRLVLLVLSTHGDQNGQNIFPSIRTLAKETRLSARSVCTHLIIAERTGWLVRRKRGVERAGRAWSGHEYDLFVPAEVLKEVQQQEGEGAGGGVEGGSTAEDARGVESGARGVEPDDIGVLKEVQHTSSVPLQRPLQEPRSGNTTVEPGGNGDPGTLQESGPPSVVKEKIQQRIRTHWWTDPKGWATFGWVELKEHFPDLPDDELRDLASRFWRETVPEKADQTVEEEQEWGKFMEGLHSGLKSRRASP